MTIANGQVEFVAVGYTGEQLGSGFGFDNIVLHSFDGVTWYEQKLPEFHTGSFWDEPNLQNVFYLGSPVNKWVIVGGNRKYWYSTNGINWTESRVTNTLPHTGDTIHDMAVRSDGTVMAIGGQGLICTTTDITAGPGAWTQRQWDANGNNYAQRIAVNGDRWCITRVGYSTGPRVRLSRDNGVTWADFNPASTFLGIATVGQIYDVVAPGNTAGGYHFRLVGRNNGGTSIRPSMPAGNPLAVSLEWTSPTGHGWGNDTSTIYSGLTGNWYTAKRMTSVSSPDYLMNLQTPGSSSNDFPLSKPHRKGGSVPLGKTYAAVDALIAAELLEKITVADVAYSPALSMAIGMGYNINAPGTEWKYAAVWRSVGTTDLDNGRWTKGHTGIDMMKTGSGAGQIRACAGLMATG